MTDLATPAIGRKIVRLMHDNRPALVKILVGTKRNLWPQLARAYLTALGVDDANIDLNTPAVLFVWSQLVKNAE